MTHFSPGKLLSGFWSLTALTFILFYSSNLRFHYSVPRLEPEINSNDDVMKHKVEPVYIPMDDKMKSQYFQGLETNNPDIFKKVTSLSNIVIIPGKPFKAIGIQKSQICFTLSKYLCSPYTYCYS